MIFGLNHRVTVRKMVPYRFMKLLVVPDKQKQIENFHFIYTVLNRLFTHTYSFAVNQGNHQNSTHPCYIINVDSFSWGKNENWGTWKSQFFFESAMKISQYL